MDQSASELPSSGDAMIVMSIPIRLLLGAGQARHSPDTPRTGDINTDWTTGLHHHTLPP